ncbi:MazG nucleotide pyrophosphohydrolase domain-containing protein [Streptomyces sp. NPDC004528]|uniref:MazG nucleotide pyrophosphohydrolase domain-containing protein n=1 Tax=Streptomyces sp. NPDC004528 TaxID=3154550 RepID=UPI0033B3B5B7
MPYEEAVAEFHRAFGVQQKDSSSAALRDVLRTRAVLVAEEFIEVQDALASLTTASQHNAWPAEEWENLAKELADLLYVVFGTADLLGIPMARVFEVVHRSNMSKLGEDGKPIYREDGKVLKGPNYQPADLSEIVDWLNGYRLVGV